MNPVEIESALTDLAQQAFAAAEFPFAFLAAFGNKDTTLKLLRSGTKNTSDLPGAVLQRNNIHLLVCDEGAVGQTLNALPKPGHQEGQGKIYPRHRWAHAGGGGCKGKHEQPYH